MGIRVGGLLVTLVIAACFASSANAASIPPTADCEVTLKKLMRTYSKEIAGKPSKEEVARAERKFADALAAAGCVSDAEPIIEMMPAKPFTTQCREAAPQAQAFWGSMMKSYVRMGKKFVRKVERPFRKRSKALTRKIRVSKKHGYARRTAVLVRKRKELKRNFVRIERAQNRKFSKLIRGDAYPTLLVLYELVSLRCVDETLFEEGGGKGPAARVVKRNAFLIFISVLFLAFEESDDSDSVSISKAAVPTAHPAGTQDKLPGHLPIPTTFP